MDVSRMAALAAVAISSALVSGCTTSEYMATGVGTAGGVLVARAIGGGTIGMVAGGVMGAAAAAAGTRMIDRPPAGLITQAQADAAGFECPQAQAVRTVFSRESVIYYDISTCRKRQEMAGQYFPPPPAPTWK